MSNKELLKVDDDKGVCNEKSTFLKNSQPGNGPMSFAVKKKKKKKGMYQF